MRTFEEELREAVYAVNRALGRLGDAPAEMTDADRAMADRLVAARDVIYEASGGDDMAKKV